MEEAAPIYNLPEDALHQIFSLLPLRHIVLCRTLSKFFHRLLTCHTFTHHVALPPLQLLSLRPSHRHVSPHPTLHSFDPTCNRWLRFPLSFLLPSFSAPHPVASSSGLVFLWADSNTSVNSVKSLIAVNPLSRTHRVLPHLGSAWSRHGSVLVDSVSSRVLVLSQLATLYLPRGSPHWLTFSSNLQSKPRSPVLVSDSVYALCDIGAPWRSQWKLFHCSVESLGRWGCVERGEWGEVFETLKRPRLVRGVGNRILMVGGLKSAFSVCSTIAVLRLDLKAMEWAAVGRMPPEMFRSFEGCTKFKAFGAGDWVCFSAKRVGKLALWDGSRKPGKGEWRWVDGVSGDGNGGLCRGFVFEAQLSAVP